MSALLALACLATDGDSIRCGLERLRLLGIDAPEAPGHCRQGRECVPGDPVAATQSLRDGMELGPITYRRIKLDRYGRTIAVVYAGGVNLSCWQLSRGAAVYVQRWDNGGIIASECR